MPRQPILRLAAVAAIALASLQAAACSSTADPSPYRFARPRISAGPSPTTTNSATVRNQMTDPLDGR